MGQSSLLTPAMRSQLFYLTLVISIILWRYGSLTRFFVFAILCAVIDPERHVVQLYDAFMRWPDYDIRDFAPPPNWITYPAMGLQHLLFPIRSHGLENLPADGRFILVGNHQNCILDTAHFFTFVFWNYGKWVRPMTDRSHYTIPFFKHYIQAVGGFAGTPENCEKMMLAGLPLLVYPGGASEVFKDERIEPYTLVWKDNAGFAKLAAKHNYTIIPFASVGFEDAMKIWFSFPAYWLFSLLGDKRGKTEYEKHLSVKTGSPVSSPTASFSKGYIPPPFVDSRIPVYAPWTLRPQANYIVFGKPIDTTEFDAANKESVYDLRDVTRSAVHGCIEHAKEMQAMDPKRFTFGGNLVGVDAVKTRKVFKEE
ncbi:Transmembrane protein 68 [Podochytrium sp. JEL0797]|nr:Transmembrane protein 68 [Podochytrium sp. JEL0797]